MSKSGHSDCHLLLLFDNAPNRDVPCSKIDIKTLFASKAFLSDNIPVMDCVYSFPVYYTKNLEIFGCNSINQRTIGL